MENDNRPQNIYDDPQFFEGYSQMERFQSGWGLAMEHSSFVELVGDVSGRRVLDLGCGAGQLAFYLAEAGAAEVIGIDASERMLDVARAQWTHPRISYRQASMEDAGFPSEAFDLVVSSLALHYVRDYAGLVGRIARWLAPCGLFDDTAATEIYTARGLADGWVIGPEGTRIAWTLDHYADEGPREHRWFVPGVRRYHRTLSTLLNGLIDAGLVLERVMESTPSDAWLRDRQQDADERRRPMFLLVRARKA
ncbi:MAG: methyltransferase domain-containing protein [Chloroflexi bacterium]|nr:methyltransferase domain-containing protein [Chloroflexota bacterium]